MGSSYFYLEFLLTWTYLLFTSGFRNPAIFALEYTLVPTACYPTQLNEAVAGYNYIVTNIAPSNRICIAGDSAGATIMLSLLLHLAQQKQTTTTTTLNDPSMAVLISPWTTLKSSNNRNTPSDYLDKDSLNLYAAQYAGTKNLINDPIVSPGDCHDLDMWKNATPKNGFFFTWGKEEVFAPEIRRLVALLLQTRKKDQFINGNTRSEEKQAVSMIEGLEVEGGIHAWPVASLFLCSTESQRLSGLRTIVEKITERMR